MRIGSFEIQEPLPELRQPHVLSSLRPWINAGNVGSVALARLERHLNAQDLSSLATPGAYFDFTRYRPTTYQVEGERRLNIPNTILRYAIGPGDFDFLFLHLLEPHIFAEEYIDSVVALLQHFKVSRHCRIGGIYDAVPHTRPLRVTGTLNGKEATDLVGVSPSQGYIYQGPTTIMNLVNDRLFEVGVENMSLMVRLPQYVQLEEDYTGAIGLLNVLCSMYGFPAELATTRRGARQYQRATTEMNSNPGVKSLVERLEAEYDAQTEAVEEETLHPLPPSVEEFLRTLDNQISDS